MPRAKLSVLSRSCVAQKAGGLPVPGKPCSAYTPRPCFARSESHSGNPAYKSANYRSVVLEVCYFGYGLLWLPTLETILGA
jgi:hypothetical protein